MAENILLFIFFALISAVCFYSVKNSFRKYILIVFNAVFYFIISAHFEGIFIFAAELIFSYYLSKILFNHKNKFFLALSVIPVASGLAFVKYFNFSNIIIPAGIAFYTLKIISFEAEIYKGTIKKFPSLGEYFIYVALFTQILSGPVMRFNDFIQKISASKFNSENAKIGFFMITAGLFKKLIVANMDSNYVNAVHENISANTSLCLWMGAFLYAVEIYADFSGYSDISNGLMKIFSIDVPDNFSAPYFSSNFKEFWARWHISFSSWLKDYIYIPLGGSRCSELRKFFNVMITFLISGAWHGSGINFILWGALHGLLVYFSPKIKILRNSFMTFILVMLLWIPFRASGIENAFLYYSHMFSGLEFSANAIVQMIFLFTRDNTCAIYAFILFTGIFFMFLHDLAVIKNKKYNFLFTFIFVSMIILFGRASESAFIYSQF